MLDLSFWPSMPPEQPDRISAIDHLQLVTPSDTETFPRVARGILIGGSGTLRMLDGMGQESTIQVSGGAYYPFKVSRVFATGTTATAIHACF